MKARAAIVGSGISGLAAAHRLTHHADITLFEAGPYFGGHTNTVDVTLPGADGRPVTHGVDTGFLVFNERTYPGLIALFAELGVTTAKSDMSFSVQAKGVLGAQALEWSGSNLDTVFAQRRNLVRPRFWHMLADLLRFNRRATALARSGADAALAQPLGDWLETEGFGAEFREGYLLPMLGCIWSCPTAQMLRFPVATMILKAAVTPVPRASVAGLAGRSGRRFVGRCRPAAPATDALRARVTAIFRITRAPGSAATSTSRWPRRSTPRSVGHCAWPASKAATGCWKSDAAGARWPRWRRWSSVHRSRA
jgi:glycine/D-amino acid oxidase-like deaminating enzyme